ncbi:hypothetical protein ITJ43_14790 [Microbacterium sp. VKM Ac-2870]|uniref:hypothetical protein n=1 Tax=Microbacterium sp. VKM Ac-2870 TaxID=2783825 RepID=UPI00188B104D|nr:hypothetical protein [Microbacterium sp. VKM Ac-2870]MBF4563397.1 hypothetical protein [Microbacterium sp. VKM Ac-2870]
MDVLVLLLALVGFGLLWWWAVRVLHRRNLPASIEGLRVEVTAPVIAEDRVLDVLWEVPVIVSNTSRRPRQVPLFGQEAHVWAGRAKYLCAVTSEAVWQWEDGQVLVLNPGAVVTASVWAQVPAGDVPHRVELHQVLPHTRRIRGALPAPIVNARTLEV